MKTEILNLIDEYLHAARSCAGALAKQFGTTDILSAVNSSGMPREGSISALGGGSYFVHGTGCRVETAEVEVDFDFGPNGSIPGFDPWKLYGFAQGNGERHSWLPDRKTFDQAIEGLIADGLLKRTCSDPNPQLLALSKLRSASTA